VLACQRRGSSVEAECLVRSEADESSFEFNIRASPVMVEGEPFTVVSLRDISAEKRRQALEQIFFHDVLNTVTGLRGWTELLRLAQGSHPGAAERIELLSRHLEREIRDHRALVQAEDGMLVPNPESLRASELLRDLDAVFSSRSGAARGRALEQALEEDLEVVTDRALLLRVLVNMVRNAFEATEPGGTVRVAVERLPGRVALPGGDDLVRFSVHNESAIPLEVQARIFQRSFSTKSQRGRGLGTYSMKLLGERYLGGAVSFASDEERGTTFWIDVPLRRRDRLPVAAC
jgi:signal transduction histidine kinase